MTLPRRALIDPEATPYYHCVSRCVRRAFLCGKDQLTGYDFEHRRAWIESRLHFLASVFAIDLCAYAIMSNHYHLVLHINRSELDAMDARSVVDRWRKLHRIPEWLDNAKLDDPVAKLTISRWRERLGSISWFMKSLNEPLARLANKEDGCKGRFWEGRFRSQALLDEASVLKCMAYVDLNPIRAKLAKTPETSDYTAIKARIDRNDRSLAPMASRRRQGFTLPISRSDYLTLVDWTGRQFRKGKRGWIDANAPPIIRRLQEDRGGLRDELSHLTRRYCRAIGNNASLVAYRDRLCQKKLKGLSI
jgi:putative transposase